LKTNAQLRNLPTAFPAEAFQSGSYANKKQIFCPFRNSGSKNPANREAAYQRFERSAHRRPHRSKPQYRQ